MPSDIHSGFVGRLNVVEMGRRRRWTPDQKAAIVEESFASRGSVAAVARRHGIASSQLFGWRREARVPVEEAGFAPAVLIEADASAMAMGQDAPVIIVELAGGGRVVIGQRASPAQVSAALKAVRR